MRKPKPVLMPTRDELLALFDTKYSQSGSPGSSPLLRRKLGYFNPDDYYEALVSKLVGTETAWADIGCGRDIFPSNRVLAKELAGRCELLFGIDPDSNVRENADVHEYFEGVVEDVETDYRFDLVTMRMVAEHVVNPVAALTSIVRLLKPNGLFVVYTPYKWAPISMVASAVPFALHNPLKRLLWNTESRDTFPTAYKMNTRRDLTALASVLNLKEELFEFLDDCRTTTAYPLLNAMEIRARNLLNSMAIKHPENCILAVYRKGEESDGS